MKNTDLTQQSAAYTAPSVRVVNVNMRQSILESSETTTDDGGGVL